MEQTWVDVRAQALFHSAAWNTRSALLRLMEGPEGVDVRGAPVRVVRRTVLQNGGGPVVVFCKRYLHRSASWRFWGRASKARREFETYALFESLGIRCARRLVCLEYRDRLGRLKEAFLVTEAVPDTMTLLEFARHPPGDLSPAARHRARLHLCGQLAGMTRALHGGGGFHNDLYWRNILVQAAHSEHPTLWWIDCPRGGRVRLPWLHPRITIKDLAALYKDSAGLCHDRERLRFLRNYLGVRKLDEDARKLMHRVIAYRKRRWPAEE